MNNLAAKALFIASLTSLDERFTANRGWVLHQAEFPILDLSFQAADRTELRLRLDFSDWNDTPPSVTLLAPDGTPLSGLPPMRPGATIFNGSPHPQTGRPFVCMIGVREYHTHPSHVNDLWASYRADGGYALGSIVDRLWNGWRRFWP
jgi:hypothetical protein